MEARNFDVAALRRMAHSPVRNYAIPGLTSSLIGGGSGNGCVRLFENSRDHQEEITPHSHRFNFQCWVLEGEVRNRLWERRYGERGDSFLRSKLTYKGEFGEYDRADAGVERYEFRDQVFAAGACYSMQASEIHSIHFSRGAKVLFFEGAPVARTSDILEPWVDGKAIHTFGVEPWMFERG